jgi:putative Mg2+ transporter-C (MgtC) family protein
VENRLDRAGFSLPNLVLPSCCLRSSGLEREIRQRSAGLRTYTLVGFASALISKYGFTDILETGRVVLDPSRIAAQIVTGIGFIGGGVIFVRFAAISPWSSPFRRSSGICPSTRWAPSSLRISYEGRRGVLREILAVCTHQEFSVSRVQVEREALGGKGQSGAQAGKGLGTGWEDHPAEADEAPSDDPGVVTLLIEVRGARSVARLAARLSEIAGVISVRVGDADLTSD